MICVSKSRCIVSGAGGVSVAERLSKKLEKPYYDKNIIKEMISLERMLNSWH
jgi:hypothetical protein